MENFDVDIYERRSSINDIGAGIVCWPNASFVLDQLNLLDQVATVSGKVSRMNRISSKGHSLGFIDINKINSNMGYSSYSIIRKDLMDILTARAAELDINIHYNCNVDSITSNNNGKATVHLDNRNSIQPDIILGADGRMNSIARLFVNGENSPIYQGFINWIGVFESQHAIFNHIDVSDYWGIGSRFGIVPISENKAYWAGGVAASQIKSNEQIGPDNLKPDLRCIFDGWDDIINTIIEETPVERINKLYMHDHNAIDVWHRDNVLLIGDSAHAPLPTSGQGACQAMEDAWHLVNLLKAGDDITTIYKKFTNRRADKCNSIAQSGRNLAKSIFNTDIGFCEKRDRKSITTDFTANAVGMAQLWSSGLSSALKNDSF